MIQTRNHVFPLAETTPLVRLAVWFILGIVAGVYSVVPVPALLVVLGLTIVVALLLRKYPLAQSLAIAVALFLLGATLAAHERDELSRSGMTVRQWQLSQRKPDGSTRLGRSRLFFLQQRQRLLTQWRQHGLEGETYSIIAAMVLGDKSALDKSLRHAYDISGASHVLALSGLHMGIIYTLLSLLMLGRRRRIVTQSLVIVALWAFVFLVGMPVSAVRAATMLTLYALLTLGYREKASLNALAFAALVILAFSPYMLFDVGFQMSFLAVLSILVLMPVIMPCVPASFLQRHRLLRWLWGLTAVSLSAQLGVAPLIAFYFGRFSTFFLLSNIVVIPAVVVILWLAVITFVVPQLTPVLATAVHGLNKVVAMLSRLPGASIEGMHPTVLQVALYYLILLCVYWIVCILFPQLTSPRSQSPSSSRQPMHRPPVGQR